MASKSSKQRDKIPSKTTKNTGRSSTGEHAHTHPSRSTHVTSSPPMPRRTANARLSRTVSSATWKSSWGTYTAARLSCCLLPRTHPPPPPPPLRPPDDDRVRRICPAHSPSVFLPARRSRKVDLPAPEAPCGSGGAATTTTGKDQTAVRMLCGTKYSYVDRPVFLVGQVHVHA